MMEGIDLWLILPAALMATASPGPSNVLIAATAMTAGRTRALVLVCGILTGSLLWSASAAMGLGALMHAHGWMIEIIRYLGAAYLMFLAFKAGHSALAPATTATPGPPVPIAATHAGTYAKGLALHLTNPKVILFFGSLYAIGVPAGVSMRAVAIMVGLIFAQSACVFVLYALLFSSPRVARGYARLRRWFDGLFAAFFAYAGIKVLTTRL